MKKYKKRKVNTRYSKSNIKIFCKTIRPIWRSIGLCDLTECEHNENHLSYVYGILDKK